MSIIKGTLKRKNSANAQELDDLYVKTSIDNVEGYDAAAAEKLAGNTIRNTEGWFTSNNPVLAAGQYGYETDTGYQKIGDGTTAWNSLHYITTPYLMANMAVEVDSGSGYEEQMNGSMYLEVYNSTTGNWDIIPS